MPRKREPAPYGECRLASDFSDRAVLSAHGPPREIGDGQLWPPSTIRRVVDTARSSARAFLRRTTQCAMQVRGVPFGVVVSRKAPARRLVPSRLDAWREVDRPVANFRARP